MQLYNLLKSEEEKKKKKKKRFKDMRYIPLSNASYKLHNYIIFHKINCAMFQKSVPKDFFYVNESCDIGHHCSVKTNINSNAFISVDYIM